jgi:hypothetical protein
MTRKELIDAIVNCVITNICEDYDGGLEAWVEDVLKDGRIGAPLNKMSDDALRVRYTQLMEEDKT